MSDRQLTTKQKKLYQLADYLDKIEERQFNMGVLHVYDHVICGTYGCIAGHAIDLFKIKSNHYNEYYGDPTSFDVAKKLGMSDEERLKLFFPWEVSNDESYSRHSDNNKTHAAKVVRNFARTGKVDWNATD